MSGEGGLGSIGHVMIDRSAAIAASLLYVYSEETRAICGAPCKLDHIGQI
jgi:hypothetical protein